MLYIVYGAISWLCAFIVELFLYTVVERITKECLSKARENEEKQAIWLIECGVLFALSAAIYVHHVPYFLFSMASFALVYTIFLHNLDFRYYLRTLMTVWQDFQEHQDSLRCHQGSGTTERPSYMMTPPLVTGLPLAASNELNQPPAGPVYQFAPSQASRIPLAPLLPPNQLQAEAPVLPSLPHSHPDLRIFQSQPAFRQPAPAPPHRDPQRNPAVVESRSATEKHIGCGKVNGDGGKPAGSFFQGLQSSIKALWKEAESDGSHPPGLFNRNQENICFMNCVLQTLPRCTNLLDHIESVLASGLQEDPAQTTFLQELLDVFRKLTIPDMEVNAAEQLGYHRLTVDTARLRKALSAVCSFKLVKDPASRGRQPQQDAAEFLMSLLGALEKALDVQPPAASTTSFARPGIHQAVLLVQTMAQSSLNRLRATYNYPSSTTIALLKQQCLEQISQANGRDSSTYMHPVAMVSDLNWLLHKNKNSSIVDDLFTGQQLSASYCSNCSSISVSTEIFRILMVHIPQEADDVSVLDCLALLTNVEQLTGSNQLHCEFCVRVTRGRLTQRLRTGSSNFQTSTPNGPIQRRPGGVVLPEIGLLSPIERVDCHSRVETGQFVPLTPLSGTTSDTVKTDGLKQTSLRHLPECLVVQLIRSDFDHEKQFNRKVLTRVRVSTDPIDLSSLVMISVTPCEPLLYTLYGVCLHSSGPNTQSGHYISYSLASDGKWYLFNDQDVRTVSIGQELERRDIQESVYLLFYRRVSCSVR